MVVAGMTLEREYADISILLNNQKLPHLLYHPGQYRVPDTCTEDSRIVDISKETGAFFVFRRMEHGIKS